MMFFILRIYINVKNYIQKMCFLTFQSISKLLWGYRWHFKGTVSQNFDLSPSFYLCQKRATFKYIYLNIFSTFYEKITKIYIKNLRHGSLEDDNTSNTSNTYAKFQVWNLLTK